MNEAFNRDCVEAMKEFPDGFFDLAVVDPPYGAGFTSANSLTNTRHHTFGARKKDSTYQAKKRQAEESRKKSYRGT